MSSKSYGIEPCKLWTEHGARVVKGPLRSLEAHVFASTLDYVIGNFHIEEWRISIPGFLLRDESLSITYTTPLTDNPSSSPSSCTASKPTQPLHHYPSPMSRP